MKEDWDQLARSIGYADERDMFEDLYVKNLMGLEDISELIGFSRPAVRRHIKSFGIIMRKRGGARSVAKQQWRLFHADQRLVLGEPVDVVTNHLSCSKFVLYRYRRTLGQYIKSPHIEKSMAIGGV